MHSTSLQCHLNVLSISTHLVSFHFISFSFSFHFISFHSVIHCTPSLKSFHLWHWWHEMISFYTCLFPCSQFMPIPFNETSALPCAGTTVTRRIETWKEFQLHIEFLGMHTRAHTHIDNRPPAISCPFCCVSFPHGAISPTTAGLQLCLPPLPFVQKSLKSTEPQTKFLELSGVICSFRGAYAKTWPNSAPATHILHAFLSFFGDFERKWS